MAKPLANGYPIGAVLMRDSIAETMTVGESFCEQPFFGLYMKLTRCGIFIANALTGSHGTTFGGSPLACALGYHVLSRVSDRSFVANIMETSRYLQTRLEPLPKWFPDLLEPEIRGRGLILGLGFKKADRPEKLVRMARERGLLILTGGKDAVRFVPSLTISREEVDLAVDVLESCLGTLTGTA